ncbi:MAG: hypothetical protein EHM20_13775 [Alphaproteobacteria bacterium]|nr:MAG: hypothetical protein EHM20_13775 [Alphaproteobacteria bacterium]
MIQILSKRAHNLLHSPQYLKEISNGGLPQSSPKWEILTDNSIGNELLSDKILTLFYSHASSSDLDMLLLESISRLVVGRNVQFLEKLSFREVENYLRDENHLSVFDQTIIGQAEATFRVVKNSLLGAIIFKKILDNKPQEGEQKAWEELSFLEKNQTVKTIILKMNSLFPTGKMLELVLVEDDNISLVPNDFPLHLGVVEAVLGSLYIITNQKSSLKVVAVQ